MSMSDPSPAEPTAAPGPAPTTYAEAAAQAQADADAADKTAAPLSPDERAELAQFRAQAGATPATGSPLVVAGSGLSASERAELDYLRAQIGAMQAQLAMTPAAQPEAPAIDPHEAWGPQVGNPVYGWREGPPPLGAAGTIESYVDTDGQEWHRFPIVTASGAAIYAPA